MNNKIKDLPEYDRPTEKCIKYGASALTDSELLAAILRTGTSKLNVLDISRNVLKSDDGKSDVLKIMDLSFEELLKIEGIGKTKAIQIMCIGALSQRIARTSQRKRENFSSPCDIANFYMEQLRHKKVEYFMAIYLDGKNNMIKDIIISKGTIDRTVACPREIFAEALKCNALKVVILHNHPSGDSTPSKADILTTKRIYDSGELLGIELVDHIIIGDNSYFSLSENNLL